MLLLPPPKAGHLPPPPSASTGRGRGQAVIGATRVKVVERRRAGGRYPLAVATPDERWVFQNILFRS